ncbi:MAG: serine protease [Saprospiraceae bacterium]
MKFDPVKSIFKVTSSVGEEFGTCFIIHKDLHHTYFLTCEHVVQDSGGVENLLIEEENVSLFASDASSNFDIAILKVSKVFDAPALELNFSPPNIDNSIHLSGHGFYSVGKQVLLESFTCSISKEMIITSSNKREKAWWITISSTNKLQQGFSGSPVLDKNGRVLGFVNQRKGSGEEGLAISIATLKFIWPEAPFYEKNTSAVQNRLHKDDSSLINFKNEIEVLKNILFEEDKNLRLIAIEGKSGMGKSRLIREYLQIIKTGDFPMRVIDLKDPLGVEALLDRLISDLGEKHFKNYQEFLFDKKPQNLSRYQEKEWHKNLNRKFFLDLSESSIEAKYFLIFDHFEKADRDFKEWISMHFLERITQKSPIVVIIGGQEIPVFSYEEKHRLSFKLDSISIDHYMEYIAQKNISIRSEDLKLVHQVCNGSPSQLVQFIHKHLTN